MSVRRSGPYETCKRHPKYKALRKPTAKCVTCCEMYVDACLIRLGKHEQTERASASVHGVLVAKVREARELLKHAGWPEPANYGEWK